VYDTRQSTPTVADDMLLISFSVQGLKQMLDICNNYSKLWRYSYNADKCTVVVFNERDTVSSNNKTFYHGNSVVSETNSNVHLGVKTDHFLTNKEAVDSACNKLRGTNLNLINSGMSPQGLNPISSKIIYTSKVIPKALYGCELWSSLSATDILRLEQSHRFLCQTYAILTSYHVNGFRIE
jgi:hypothetical protein